MQCPHRVKLDITYFDATGRGASGVESRLGRLRRFLQTLRSCWAGPVDTTSETQ